MSHSRSNAVESLRPQSTAFLDVLRKHLAIFSEHYRQPISELSVLAYAEDLRTLSAERLDAACREARRSSEFMPVSATILEADKKLQGELHAETLLGPARPKYLDKPGMSNDDREAALRDLQAMRIKMRGDLRAATPKEICARQQLLRAQTDELKQAGYFTPTASAKNPVARQVSR